MNHSPSGDEEQHTAPRSESPPNPGGFSVSRLTFSGSVLLIVIAFSLGLSYLFQQRWHHLSTPRQSLDQGSAPSRPDMLRVTAVSLSLPRTAIVNGKTMTEGESITIATPSGPASVRVGKIEEQTVHFLGERGPIDVSVNPIVAPESIP